MKKLIAIFLLSIATLCSSQTKLPDGNYLLTPQQLESLQKRLQASVDQAYVLGVKEGAEAALEILKDNPKLCPKDT